MLYPPGRVWPEAAANSVHMTNYMKFGAAMQLTLQKNCLLCSE